MPERRERHDAPQLVPDARVPGIVWPVRGPLLSPLVVFQRYFAEGFPQVPPAQQSRWVMRCLPETLRVRISPRRVAFHQHDVEDHLRQQRGVDSASAYYQRMGR